MNDIERAILNNIEKNADDLFRIACDIFDHPEQGSEEKYASSLLEDFLERKGFAVERGIAGLPTAFRATWERGECGPSIGFLLEYDALRGMGHACGHHLQGPVCILAALALMEACDEPLKLVLYGTPDEEIHGGKIAMERKGCFRDVDVMFAYHTGRKCRVSSGTRALAPTRVTFRGTPSHASISPEKGRSALDAMMLAFHGLEIMREHVEDGCRIQYTVLEGTGATNIVHEEAKAHITLRSYDRRYLEEMYRRMVNVINGACMMTETTAEINPLDVYWNVVPVKSLQETVVSVAERINAERLERWPVQGGGSTDVGNVSWVVPTVMVDTYLCDAPAHTAQWLQAGKTEDARRAMVSGAKIISLAVSEIIEDKELLEKIKEEHRLAVEER